jgi:hypothetical protein
LEKIDEAIDWCSTQVGYSIRRAYVDYYFGANVEPDLIISHELYSGTFLRIPANVLSVEAVYYRNTSDTETTLSASDYEFVNIGEHIPKVRIINSPDMSDTGYGFRVRVIEGWYTSENGSTGNALDVLPYQIKSAIKMAFVSLYEHRNDVGIVQTYKLQEGATARLMPYVKFQIL